MRVFPISLRSIGARLSARLRHLTYRRRVWWFKTKPIIEDRLMKYAVWGLSVCAVVGALVLWLVWFRRLHFDCEDLRYLLSANAQAMAAALALSFAISQLTHQLTAKYGLPPSWTDFGTAATIMFLFILAIVLPLVALGVPDRSQRHGLAVLSLAYSCLCLLFLLPWVVSLGLRFHPRRLFDSILPIAQVPQLNRVGAEEQLQKVEAVFAAAAKAGDVGRAMGGVLWMDSAIRAAIATRGGLLQMDRLLQLLLRLVIWTKSNLDACIYVMDMVHRVGNVLAAKGYVEPVYSETLNALPDVVEAQGVGLLGRLAVRRFLELCRMYVDTARLDEVESFFSNVSPRYDQMVEANARGASGRDLGIEWCKGLWLLSGAYSTKNYGWWFSAAKGLIDGATQYFPAPSSDTKDVSEEGYEQALKALVEPEVIAAMRLLHDRSAQGA